VNQSDGGDRSKRDHWKCGRKRWRGVLERAFRSAWTVPHQQHDLWKPESSGGSGIFADGFDVQAKIVNNIIVAFPGQFAVFCGNLNDVNPPIFQNNDVVAPSGYPYAGLCTNQKPV